MNAAEVRARFPDFDTSDVDRWIGVPTGGGQMKEPVTATDIRRWVQGMQNPNPLHWDDAYAAASRFGKLVAPQSFAVSTSDSHGAGPAIQGNIPGTHMLFGGDEWWFEGPRIEPGDKITLDRALFDYKVTDTKFAGPTMFSRGDTIYAKQDGTVVCKQRSTSIRYRADEARKRGVFTDAEEPRWTVDEIAAFEAKKLAYYRTFLDLGHGKRGGVEVGQSLPTRPIGPHTIATFTCEWRAFLMSVWGTFESDGGASSLYQAGWLPEMSRDLEAAKVDPTLGDGLYHGPSRGHVQAEYAQLIGMPRGYGYGASMGAWILDTLANWAGEHGFILHSDMKYRAPALTGDVTFVDGRVVDLVDRGMVAVIDVAMTNQRGEGMAQGTAEVRLPPA
jgi:acyl dehydratase